jgi:ATP-dependent RNA helicase RhlE
LPPPSSDAGADVFSLLIEPLRRAVAEEGYTVPTPIQQAALPHVLAGRDLFGIAQTGTGKTAAFTLPMLQHLATHPQRPARGQPRILVLAPTRELAAQIGESIRAYGRHVSASHCVIFGGVGQVPQVSAVNRGVDIVVATPGRLLDLMRQKHVRFDHLEILVLDEADRMLDMGFIRDIRTILATLPKQRQSLFFSATMSPPVLELARAMVNDPVQVAVTPEQPTVERIVQKVMFVDRTDKDALLAELLKDPAVNRVIVFVQMKHAADKVARKLADVGIPAVALHGNKSQGARTHALAGFRSGRIRVMVATDIAARGLDVDDISHIINYDLPNEPETYVHRIGRTARAGASGDAVSFCAADERDYLRAIERLIRKTVPVDTNHSRHSETARLATGAAAKPAPKRQQQGGGRRNSQQGGGRGGHGDQASARTTTAGGGRGGPGGRPRSSAGGGGSRGGSPRRKAWGRS